MSTFIIVFGTRPEYLKICELTKLINNSKLCWIKQHNNIKENITADYILNFSEYTDNRLNNIIINTLILLNTIPLFDYYIIQGDTATAYATSLFAFQNKKKIIHIEAGLRSFDMFNPYPEEFYRINISKMANIHFCPTEHNKQNLLNENIKNNIFVVGNTIIDIVKKYNFSISYDNFIIITYHRRENWDNYHLFLEKINNLKQYYNSIHFIFIKHPNKDLSQLTEKYLQNIEIIDPMNHFDFCKLLSRFKFIISDSGGLQEEACILGKKIICMRKFTERNESVGFNTILCNNIENLDNHFKYINNNYIIEPSFIYGNGNTSILISNEINKL